MELVNHPSHYGGADNPYEVIKVIEAWGLDFHLGNVVKYIPRAGKKSDNSELQDLKKAAFYLNRKIALLEEKELLDSAVEHSVVGVKKGGLVDNYPMAPEECFPELPWGEITEVEKCKTCGAQLTYEESSFGWECMKCCQKHEASEQAPYISPEDDIEQKDNSVESNIVNVPPSERFGTPKLTPLITERFGPHTPRRIYTNT